MEIEEKLRFVVNLGKIFDGGDNKIMISHT